MELIVKLPDPLANEAKAAGLLAPQASEKLLREAIERRRQIDSFVVVSGLRWSGRPARLLDAAHIAASSCWAKILVLRY